MFRDGRRRDRRCDACSPRRRGCSAVPDDLPWGNFVLPAQAGVFRPLRSPPWCEFRAPRAGGGVPAPDPGFVVNFPCSPRRRGCSDGARFRPALREVLPAQAGVFRKLGPASPSDQGAPRAGGGVPPLITSWAIRSSCSPRRRGCSESVGTCPDALLVLPAQAGVFRPAGPGLRRPGRAPRAGGGVPPCLSTSAVPSSCSPRRRGCSVMGLMLSNTTGVLPAQAGVFRLRGARSSPPTRAPRAGRGVPPVVGWIVAAFKCSPRRRGCSAALGVRRAAGAVVPAQAGASRRCRSAPSAASPQSSRPQSRPYSAVAPVNPGTRRRVCRSVRSRQPAGRTKLRAPVRPSRAGRGRLGTSEEA